MLRAILLILMLSPFSAFGCSCGSQTKSLTETIKEYDAIFTGIALNTEKTPGDWISSFHKTEMKVQQAWINQAVPRSVFIKTNIESHSCGGPPPEIGNRFLVFANLMSDGFYYTGGCSTFIDLDQMEKDLSLFSPEGKLEWQTFMADMWSDLGKPLVVYSK